MRKRWRWLWLGPAFGLVALALKLAGTGDGPVYEDKTARAWLRELSRSEPARREAAFRAFVAMGEEAVPFLKQELTCRDSAMKRALIVMDRRSSLLNIDWITDVQRRYAAINAAVGLGESAEVLVPALLEGLYDEMDIGLFHASTEVFLAIGSKAIPSMVRAMNNPRPGVCIHDYVLFEVWVKLNRSQPIHSAVILEILDVCLQRLTHTSHDSEVAAAIRLIGEFPDQADPALPSLINLLQHGSPEVCQASITTLQSLGRDPDQVVQALISRLNDPDAAVRRAAVKSLPHWGAAAIPAIPAMAALVRDKTRGVQLAALTALGQMRVEAGSSGPMLVEVLEHGETWVKAEAARTLGLVHPDPALAVPALTQALLREYDRDIRCHAATSLGALGTVAASAVDALVATLDDHREPVQVCVVQALGKIGGAARPAIPYLMAAWNNNQSLLAGPVQEALRIIEQQSVGGE